MLLLVTGAHADPVFDVERGLQEAPFTLTITGDGGTLLVSTDGSAPSAPYTGPLSITTTTLVRAQEIAADGTASPVVTQTYIFPDDVVASSVMDPAITGDPEYGPVVARSLRDLPSISLVVPGGLSLSEQAASFEWMDPEGTTKQVDCGAYISGGTSWAYEKTSFRLVFRSIYGPGKLDLDVYGPDATGVEPATEHDALSLRSGNHDTVFWLGARGQHLRNFWMDETQLDMGHVAPHGRFAHVYVNGVYNGLYHVRERFNAAMLAEYLGGDEDDYEAINGGSAFDGSGAAWAALVTSSGDFQVAKEWLDVDDFLDYMVLNFYAANAWDWSSNHNWIAAGPTTAGAGGFRFHCSDSDVCLVYDYTTNILSNGGPSDVFARLLAEGDPDFLVALEDAIHRDLTGPLTAENARARYARLATLADDGIVAESARWGFGWWDHDEEWVTERDWLLDTFFPNRTDELWRQFRAAGWYPLDAPVLDTASGVVSAGTDVGATAPEGSTAELWVAIDGQDPRLSGGVLATGTLGPDAAQSIPIRRSTLLKARLRDGDTWGPIAEAFYEVDEPPALVLNEWNAVDDDGWLGGDDAKDADAALGRIEGNGGDWIELLATQDVDLRGWTLTMEDRAGPRGTLVFTDDPLLADVRAGTVVTIAEDLPEDASYDPDGGDWRFHLRAGASGSGRYVSASAFDVTSRDWQLTVQDADGAVVWGPSGEGVSPARGVSGHEVGILAETPGASTRRASGYAATTRSTFGAPNAWEGGEQDLSSLRGRRGGVVDAGDTGDTGVPAAPVDDPAACGCGGNGAGLGLLALLAIRRRRA